MIGMIESILVISGSRHPLGTHHRRSAALTTFKALYPFNARNDDELSFESDDLIEVSLRANLTKPANGQGLVSPQNLKDEILDVIIF